ncbi:MAG: hypothetical protein J3Q66DRAFT_350338 [Benniella sp.]|nr:MAG: hypothetical protein J3Q66DRAFT_350338 [Benniella sp.]
MVGRSLFSLLAVAAVAIQSCVAALIPDGEYRIVIFGQGGLSAPSSYPGSPVWLSESEQTWIVQNLYNDVISIRLGFYGSPVFAAPLQKANHAPVQLNSDLTLWRVSRGEAGFILEPLTSPTGERLVLGIAPSDIEPRVVEIQKYEPGRKDQSWTFFRASNFKQETGNGCGPRRFPKDFFLQ